MSYIYDKLNHLSASRKVRMEQARNMRAHLAHGQKVASKWLSPFARVSRLSSVQWCQGPIMKGLESVFPQGVPTFQ